MPGKGMLTAAWRVTTEVHFMVNVSMMILKYRDVVTWGKERSFQQFDFEEPGVE